MSWFTIKEKKVGKYEWNLMETILCLHMYVTGAAECYDDEDIDCFEFIDKRLKVWHNRSIPCTEKFDAILKQLCEEVLVEYKNSFLFNESRPRLKELGIK